MYNFPVSSSSTATLKFAPSKGTQPGSQTLRKQTHTSRHSSVTQPRLVESAPTGEISSQRSSQSQTQHTHAGSANRPGKRRTPCEPGGTPLVVKAVIPWTRRGDKRFELEGKICPELRPLSGAVSPESSNSTGR